MQKPCSPRYVALCGLREETSRTFQKMEEEESRKVVGLLQRMAAEENHRTARQGLYSLREKVCVLRRERHSILDSRPHGSHGIERSKSTLCSFWLENDWACSLSQTHKTWIPQRFPAVLLELQPRKGPVWRRNPMSAQDVSAVDS